MKVDDPERWARLEQLCGKTYLDVRDLYGATSKDKRRGALAHALSQEVLMVPPSRLMALVGQALKWWVSGWVVGDWLVSGWCGSGGGGHRPARFRREGA